MGRSEREKGSRAEREFINAVHDELGDFFGPLDKNWNQREEKRFDLKLGPFGVEIKRAEQLRMNTWWDEAVEQVQGTELMPMLAYRQNRQPWTIVITLVDCAYLMSSGEECLNLQAIQDDRKHGETPAVWHNDRSYTLSMPLPAFAVLCREYMNDATAKGERPP